MTRSTRTSGSASFPALPARASASSWLTRSRAVKKRTRAPPAFAGAGYAHAIGADRYGDMRFAGAGSADQHGVALGGEKAAPVELIRQLAHQTLVDRRHREVELGEVLHHREARHP